MIWRDGLLAMVDEVANLVGARPVSVGSVP